MSFNTTAAREFLVELAEGPGNALVQFGLLGGLGHGPVRGGDYRSRLAIGVRLVERTGRPAFQGSPVRDREIDGNPEQPGVEIRTALEFVAALPTPAGTWIG